PLGLGYEALRRHELALGEGSVPSTSEIGLSFRSMSEQQRVEETLTPRPRVRTTWVDPVDGTVFRLIYHQLVYLFRHHPYPSGHPIPSQFHHHPPAVRTPVASLVTTPSTTIAVDKDEFLEVREQLELHKSILYDHTQLWM
ncbi:hypothetical protein Tco_0440568, partial [Tanacetum coccineum]